MTNPSDQKKYSMQRNSDGTMSIAGSTGGGGDKPCRVCERIGPMAFRMDPWCSDDHRKVVKGEVKPGPRLMASMQQSLLRELKEVWEDL